MRTRSRLHVLSAAVAAVGLLVTGCSSTDDVDPDPAAPSTTGATADAGTGATTPESTTPLDVCDLLEPSDYKRFIRKDLQASLSEDYSLSGYAGSVRTCTIRSGPFSLFSFGYAVEPDTWAGIERWTRPQKVPRNGDKTLRDVAKLAAQKRENMPNLADEAFLTESLGGSRLYALEGGVSFELGVVGLAGGRDDVTVGDYGAVMITLLANAAGGVVDDPVVLPPECPPADSPEVTDLLGEVTHALGSAYRGKAPSCSYTAADGRTLRASATLYATPALFDLEAIRPERTAGMTVLDPPPGTSSGIERDGRDWTWRAALPARRETVRISTDRVVRGARPTGAVDRAAFLAFVDAYRALASEQLDVDY